MGIGWKELLMILLVVLLVFGTKKLKTIGSDLGSAVKGFKQAMNDGEKEEQAAKTALPPSTEKDADFGEPANKSGTKSGTGGSA